MSSKTSQDIRVERRGEAARLPEDAIGAELRIVEWQNEWIVRGAFPFAYQAPDDMLTELRRRYELDEVVKAGRTEFEQMLLLLEWVHTRWKHGSSLTPPARNALEILRAAEQGGDFMCGWYSVTLMQCLLALGFVARTVSIAKTATEWMADDERGIGHSITEVWSHQFHKWIILDPDYNVYYERDGTPLSALDIHHAWVSRRWNEVRMVEGPTPFRLSDMRNVDEFKPSLWTALRHNLGDWYADVGILMGNTQHSNADSLRSLRWMDEWTPPNIVDRNHPTTAAFTSNEHDMYWTVDQVQINLTADQAAWEQKEAMLHVSLEHSMPNISSLLVRLGEEAWRETGPDFSWKLHPGKNQIMAKAVNAFGREGHTSRIVLRYHP